jgi:hypothetical protein
MIGVLFISAALSPVWKGGALTHTLDFAKVWVVWILTFLLVTDFARLRRLVYIQSASVAVICVVSIILGHNQPRLEGVIGGIYSNSNDLAFAIVLTLPFCLAFLLSAKGSAGPTELDWGNPDHGTRPVHDRFAGRIHHSGDFRDGLLVALRGEGTALLPGGGQRFNRRDFAGRRGAVR